MRRYWSNLIIFTVICNASCKISSGTDHLESTDDQTGKTFFLCSESAVSANKGFRLRVLKNADGTFLIELLQGNALTGTIYLTKKTSGSSKDLAGRYSGLKDNRFKMDLTVSDNQAKNPYILGYSSDVDTYYPSVRSKNGQEHFKTDAGLGFVCGKNRRP
jgi:hypothetical protein